MANEVNGMACACGVAAGVGTGVISFESGASGSTMGVMGGELSKIRDDASEIVRSRFVAGIASRFAVDMERMVVRDVRCSSELEVALLST